MLVPSLSSMRFPLMFVPLITSSESIESVAARLTASVCLFFQVYISIMPLSIRSTPALCFAAGPLADVHIPCLFTESRLKLYRCMFVVAKGVRVRRGILRNMRETVETGVPGKSLVERRRKQLWAGVQRRR
jgi:hypothetical protein